MTKARRLVGDYVVVFGVFRDVFGEEWAERDDSVAAVAQYVEGLPGQFAGEAVAAELRVDLAVGDDHSPVANVVDGLAGQFAVGEEFETVMGGVVPNLDVHGLQPRLERTPYRGRVLKPTSRLSALFASAALAAALLAGCGDDNVNCGVDSCTVTIDRSTNASASVLGVEAKFISADANTVTVEVAGEQVQLTKGQQAVAVGGLQVSLDSVTQDQIGLQISR